MSSEKNVADAIVKIEEIASKFEAVDKLIAESWMKFPQNVRDKLNAEGFGSKFDALTQANKLRAVAEKIR